MSHALDRLRRVTSRYVDRPLLALPLPIRAHRALFELKARGRRRAAGLHVERREVGGVPVRVAGPRGPRARLLWLHGGGFVLGSPETHAPFLDRLAIATKLEVWTPDYRLAPEHPFPAAVEDCLAVARAMEAPWHLGGDSAGGNLALGVLADALERGAAPRSVTLISPSVDLRWGRDPGDVDEMLLPMRFIHRCRAAYVGDADAADPRLSPVLGRYPDGPPVHIELSARELLERDGRAIADRLRQQGTPVTTHVEYGVPHVYHLAVGRSAAADAALSRVARHMA